MARQWHPLIGIVIVGLALAGCCCRIDVDAESYVVRAHQDLMPPPSGKALVVFLWPNHAFKTMNTPIYQDDIVVGALRAQTYFPYIVSPGTYHFATATGFAFRQREEVELRVRADHTYFLRFTPALYPEWYLLEQIGQDTALGQLTDLKQLHLLRTPSEQLLLFLPDSREEIAADAAP